MKHSGNQEFGGSRALLLGGLALLLALVVGALLFVMDGGPSDEEKAREAQELEQLEAQEGGGGRRIPGQDWKGKEAPPPGGGKSFRRLASLQGELNDQLKAGSKTEEEMDKKYSGPPMDVAVQGPKELDPRAPELFKKMKEEYLKKIADCYKQSLSSKPSLRGRLNLSLSVMPTKNEDVGQVQAVVGKGSTIQDMKLSACVTRRVSRMTVPGIYAVEQKDTVFEYPLQLDPGEVSAAAPLEPPPPDNNPDPDTPEGKARLKVLEAKAAEEMKKRGEMPAPGENVAPPVKPGQPPEDEPPPPPAQPEGSQVPGATDDPDSPNYRPPAEPVDPHEGEEPPPPPVE
jgi:hypothetical protein